MSNPPQTDDSAPVNIEAIMDDIRARTTPFPAVGAEENGARQVPVEGSAAPPPIHPAPAGGELYSDLHAARTSADVSQLPLSIAGGKQGIGGAIRKALHNLTLYYVNLLAVRQTAFNRAIISAVSRMVDQMERRDLERIRELEREVQELKARQIPSGVMAPEKFDDPNL